ncbi:MAG: hypothetical protein D6763_06150 [Alphaproteobacteria bacterium]|nr:MAG: hypothetical protein D6763_06150 [Alphaproteobacteria bacterium]
MIRRLLHSIFAVAALTTGASQAAEELVTDISSHQIAITSRFSGTSLLLFGAVDWFEANVDYDTPTDARAYDIVVVVRGPEIPHVVRKKDRVTGIWINTEAARLKPIPGYYALSASRPLDDMFLPGEAEKYSLGLDQVSFEWDGTPPKDPDAYRAAVLRIMRANGLYTEKFGRLQILGETLFRTEIYFPVNVPVGRYEAHVYLVRDGVVVTHQSTPLSVDKTGIERVIYDFAKTRPAAYGVMAVALALVAGLIAGTVSRRFSH